MQQRKRNRMAFRPCADPFNLEDRTVLSAAGGGVPAAIAEIAARAAALRSHAQVGGMISPYAASSQVSSPTSSTQQSTVSSVTSRYSLFQSYSSRFQAAANDLKSYLGSQITQLYASGQPSSAQLNNLQLQVIGAMDATTLRVSSQIGLLPGSSSLVSGVQDAFLANNGVSLVDRLNGIVGYGAFNASASRLTSVLNSVINREVSGLTSSFESFLRNAPVYRMATDQTGQIVPIQQYMAQQAVSHFTNAFGALAQGYPTVASALLFPGGATSATPQLEQSLQTQTLNALSAVNYQLAGDLSVLSNVQPGLAQQLQQAFYGASGDPSLYSVLSALPATSTGFTQAATSAFSTSFQNIAGMLNTSLGLTPSSSPTLPTGQTQGIFGNSYSNYGAGFNNGFGNGFYGFGTAPAANSAYFTGFNSGFYGLNNSLNTSFGFTLPTLTGSGTGTTGTGTTGTGTTGIGTTGTGTTGTGTTGIGTTGTGTTGTGTTGTGTTGTGTTGTGTTGIGTTGIGTTGAGTTGLGNGTSGTATVTGTGLGAVGTGTGVGGTGLTGTGAAGTGTGTGLGGLGTGTGQGGLGTTGTGAVGTGTGTGLGGIGTGTGLGGLGTGLGTSGAGAGTGTGTIGAGTTGTGTSTTGTTTGTTGIGSVGAGSGTSGPGTAGTGLGTGLSGTGLGTGGIGSGGL